MRDHATIGFQQRCKLRHAHIRLRLNPGDQSILMGRQLAGATRTPLNRRFKRPCLRHALRQSNAGARTDPKAFSSSTARLAQRYGPVNPLPKINRM
eukprot:gene38140-43204_t